MEKMNTWYFIALGDGVWAPTLSTQIEEIFLPLFDKAGKPTDMAIFTRNESEGKLYCEVIAYFSPAAQAMQRHLTLSRAKNHHALDWVCWRVTQIAGCSFSQMETRKLLSPLI
jgi:hypothetical protein